MFTSKKPTTKGQKGEGEQNLPTILSSSTTEAGAKKFKMWTLYTLEAYITSLFMSTPCNGLRLSTLDSTNNTESENISKITVP